MTRISLSEASELLYSHDNIEILTHRYPDGDTIGSAYALCLALQSIGKNARVLTAGTVSKKFLPFTSAVKAQDFRAQYTVSVDVAAPSLLGKLQQEYENKIDLCIDHHGSNSMQAENVFVDSSAAAAGEIIFDLLKLMNVTLTKEISDALYLAISTDTGCFMYSNTSARTLRTCAELLEAGVDNGSINHKIFEEKTKAKIELEKRVYETLTYFCSGKAAMITVTKDMVNGLDDSETEGLASIPRQIDGVVMGITVREKEDCYRVSVRTNCGVDASQFCAQFGGGGHPAAAGCSLFGTCEQVRQTLIKAAEEFL